MCVPKVSEIVSKVVAEDNREARADKVEETASSVGITVVVSTGRVVVARAEATVSDNVQAPASQEGKTNKLTKKKFNVKYRKHRPNFLAVAVKR